MTKKEMVKMLKTDVLGFNSWRKQNPDCKVDLSGVDLAYAKLLSVNLAYADLFAADLSYAELCKAALTDANLQYSNLRGSNLTDAKLSFSNLRGADLTESKMIRSKCIGTKLRNANLLDADLTGIDLHDTDLHNAKFDFVKLQNKYEVYIHKGYMQIGCEKHLISEWKEFSDSEINDMDSGALEWWKLSKEILFFIIERKGFDND